MTNPQRMIMSTLTSIDIFSVFSSLFVLRLLRFGFSLAALTSFLDRAADFSRKALINQLYAQQQAKDIPYKVS